MDQTRRTTLKRLAGIAAAGSSISAASDVMADHCSPENMVGQETANQAVGLARIQVHTRVSASSNDIELVITNISDQPVRITQITPSQTSTSRGVFNISTLLEKGDLGLNVNQSIIVPMSRHSNSIAETVGVAQHSQSLCSALRSSFSVVTESDAFATVDIIEGLRFS
ncbi:MAG: hypothetical protein AB8B63_08975 [Granulosicoccus sp.]